MQEPGLEGGVSRQLRREDLERHRTVKALVPGKVDDRHGAPADITVQTVTGYLARHSRVGQDRLSLAAHGRTTSILTVQPTSPVPFSGQCPQPGSTIVTFPQVRTVNRNQA